MKLVGEIMPAAALDPAVVRMALRYQDLAEQYLGKDLTIPFVEVVVSV